MRRLLALLLVVGASALPATAVAEPGPPLSGTVTLALSASFVEYGDPVVATGQVEPASPGEDVVLELALSDRVWLELARTTADATGAFAVELSADRGGTLRARAVTSGLASVPVSLLVSPKVALRVRPGLAFVGARLSARIRPADYEGTVTVTVTRDGRAVARVTARAARGRLRTTVPTPGIGRFTVTLGFPAAYGLSERSVTAHAAARGRRLAQGSSGADVRALARRLAELRFHVPSPSSAFGPELIDAVIAFQKAYGLERTGVVGPATWRKLERAAVVRPRYRGPSPHIEIDKTRQILLLVRGGKVAAVLPVSTGATGNTPEGRHQIRWKAPATTTWLGSGILYRTMTFYGNSFAIHGWVDVPPYPASHGCVRIPIWTADWLYGQSPVGETVYVYS